MLNWKPLDLIKSPSLKLFLLSVSEINSKNARVFTDNDFLSNIDVIINLLWLLSVTLLLLRAFNSGALQLHYPGRHYSLKATLTGIYKPNFLLSWLIQYALLVHYFRNVTCCQAISKKCFLMYPK